MVTALRKAPSFVRSCAATPGHAAAGRHDHKLRVQYADRLPHTQLHPLVVEVGGRWHPTVPPLLRRLAREYVRHSLDLGSGSGSNAVGLVVARWMARLSAIFIRSNAAVHHRAGYAPLPARVGEPSPGGPLAHLVPEGDSAYELWVH